MPAGQPPSTPRRRRSIGDRITSVLLTFYGPAQLGRELSTDSRIPEGAGPDAVPADAPPPSGFRVEIYTDERGVQHRSIVRIDG